MHTLGKVLLGIVIVATIAAIPLSAKWINVRNSWTEKAEAETTRNLQNAEQIAEKKRELRELEAEYTRLTLGWGQSWNTANSGVLNPQGQVQAGLGTQDGLLVPTNAEKPLLHAFRPSPDADGSYLYVGPYRATDTLRDDLVIVEPMWTPRAGEMARMQQGPATWRFREELPPQYVARFLALQQELTKADDDLAARQLNLQIQAALDTKAGELLDLRKGELTGDPAAREVPGLPEYTEGLVKVLADVEEQRNNELAELDDLRRELKRETDRMLALIEQNRQLADSLPKPDASSQLTSN